MITPDNLDPCIRDIKIKIRHHFVPQVILKNFTYDGTHLWVFKKKLLNSTDNPLQKKSTKSVGFRECLYNTDVVKDIIPNTKENKKKRKENRKEGIIDDEVLFSPEVIEIFNYFEDEFGKLDATINDFINNIEEFDNQMENNPKSYIDYEKLLKVKYYTLLIVSTMIYRNPIIIETITDNFKDAMSKSKSKRINDPENETIVKDLYLTQIFEQECKNCIEEFSKDDYVIYIYVNKTEQDFIISDYPVGQMEYRDIIVKNETFNIEHTNKTAIFNKENNIKAGLYDYTYMPINPKYCILIKKRDESEKQNVYFRIAKEEEVEIINQCIYINAINDLYFTEKMINKVEEIYNLYGTDNKQVKREYANGRIKEVFVFNDIKGLIKMSNSEINTTEITNKYLSGQDLSAQPLSNFGDKLIEYIEDKIKKDLNK